MAAILLASCASKSRVTGPPQFLDTSNMLSSVGCETMPVIEFEHSLKGPGVRRVWVHGDGFPTGSGEALAQDTGVLFAQLVRSPPFFATNIPTAAVRHVPSSDVFISDRYTERRTAFALKYNGREAECWFDNTAEAVRRVGCAALSAEAGDMTLVVALVKVPTGAGPGCTIGAGTSNPVTIVTHSSDKDVLVHEAGHAFAGLYDEIDGQRSFSGILDRSDRNCATDVRGLPWHVEAGTKLPTTVGPGGSGPIGAYPGCGGFKPTTQLYHPEPQCLMGSDRTKPFGAVCFAHVARALVTPGTTPTDSKYTRLLFSVVRGSPALSFIAARETFARSNTPPINVRFAARVDVGPKHISIPIAGDPFLARAYQSSQRRHSTLELSKAAVIVEVPLPLSVLRASQLNVTLFERVSDAVPADDLSLPAGEPPPDSAWRVTGRSLDVLAAYR